MREISGEPGKIDWKDIQNDIDQSLKQAQHEIANIHINVGDIQKEVDKALGEVDLDQVIRNSHEEMQQAIKNLLSDGHLKQLLRRLKN